ncbi:IS5 family transposase [Roseovarius nitratireducens]|uniref:IS5 family transposase n=1 Tax=Roseovarius nitratireducens TaxID=2044597 RepID=UPI0023E7F4BB|nr:IS5 family transposase [Roseovarius nitratireducens]
MGRLPRRQKTLAVNIPYRGSKGPLDLLVDSTGIKVEGEGEWHARKHGGSKRRVWRKIHLGIDEQTLEVRAVEVTGSHIGDSPMLPELLDQIPADQEVGSVTADGAYDTRKCHDAIADRGVHAVVPPRRNAKPWKASHQHQGCRGAQRVPAGLEIPRSCDLATMERIPPLEPRRDQDALYEPKVREAKLLGQRLMARDFDRQIAEIHVRIAVLNGYTALGIPITEPVG